jgi:vancomycin permeability regulator SanA
MGERLRQLGRRVRNLWRTRRQPPATRRWSRPKRLLALLVALAGLVLLLSYPVGRAARGRLYRVADAPARPVAIVFGAGVRADGSLTSALADRVDTAVELYHAGKVQKLLMSGDNSRPGYDEPTAMKGYALSRGVPASAIELDFAGYHTHRTCARARRTFGVSEALLVTQGYHLPRALYLCRAVGIDAVGVIADRRLYQRYLWYLLREQGSRARAFLLVQLSTAPPLAP